ncbi:MAG: serine hydrolase [Chloroflexota bacterium]|nr:serine hydrolase [Chloroflexota bacterium]
MYSNLNLGYRRRRKSVKLVSWISLLSILAASILTGYQYILFSNYHYILPEGVLLADVAVENLHRDKALAKLYSIYNSPITIYYENTSFILDPTQIEFQIKGDAMLKDLDLPKQALRFWFNLLGQQQAPYPQNVPLQAAYSNSKLREFLHDVALRYDRPVYAPMTELKHLMTITSTPGKSLQIDESISAISTALSKSADRNVQLIVKTEPAISPTFKTLEIQLGDYLKTESFKGLLSIFIADLNTNTILHRNWMEGTELTTDPDIAFSGMSIIKITFLVEFYRQINNEGALPYELDLIEKSITESSNWTSNVLIDWIGDLDPNLGLKRLNNTYNMLGLNSTFIGGLYDSEEIPGFRHTPANSRTDITTEPDPYMQTTASDIGLLLKGIYECSRYNTGLLIEVFGDQITQSECLSMIEWLSKNKIGVLLEAGVPEGTKIAHKHGWAEGEPIGDAGIVFTPSGDYVIVYYIWVPEYTYWDNNARILSDINKAIYYYFNPIIHAP